MRPPRINLRFDRSPSGLWLPTQPNDQEAPTVTRQHGTFVPHDELFPDQPNDFAEFKRVVRSLSLTDAIFWCARLNILLHSSDEERLDLQRDSAAVFFTNPEVVARANKFAREHGGPSYVRVFFRGQLLELLRWVVLLCRDDPNDGKTFDDPNVRTIFLRAALLASDVWSRRVYGERFDGTLPVETLRRNVLPSVRLVSQETASSPNPFVALARGASLFADRLCKLQSNVSSMFESVAGLSLDDYLAMLSEIAAAALYDRKAEGLHGPEKSGLFRVSTYEEAAEPVGAIARKFFAQEAQTASQLRQALWGKLTDATEEEASKFDLLPLRSKPIFRAEDGRGIILDPVFFVERGSAGPLFRLTQADRHHAQRWFGAFGDVVEDYVHDMLKRMYPTKKGSSGESVGVSS